MQELIFKKINVYKKVGIADLNARQKMSFLHYSEAEQCAEKSDFR